MSCNSGESNTSTSEDDSLGLLSEEQLESPWCEFISERELRNDSQNLKFSVESEISCIIDKENSNIDLSMLESKSESINEELIHHFQNLKFDAKPEVLPMIEKSSNIDPSVLERKPESINEKGLHGFRKFTFDMVTEISPIIDKEKSKNLNVLESTPKIKQSAQEIIEEKEEKVICSKEILNKTVRISSVCNDSQDKISENSDSECELNITHNVENEYNENFLNKTFDKSNLLNVTLPNIGRYSKEHLDVEEQNVWNKIFSEDFRLKTRDEDISSPEITTGIVKKIRKKEISHSSYSTLHTSSSSCYDSATTLYPQSSTEESISIQTLTKKKVFESDIQKKKSTEESSSIQTGTKKKVFKSDIQKEKFIKTSKKEKNVRVPRNIISISDCDPNNFGSPSAVDDNRLKNKKDPPFSLTSPFSTTKRTEGTDDIKKTGMLWIPIDNTAIKKIPPKKTLNLSFKKMPKEEMSKEEKRRLFKRDITFKNEDYLKKMDKKIRKETRHHDHKLFSYMQIREIKRMRGEREPLEVPTFRLVPEAQKSLKEITKGRSSCIPRASRLPILKSEPRPLLKSEGQKTGPTRNIPHQRNPAERIEVRKPLKMPKDSGLQAFSAGAIFSRTRAEKRPNFPARDSRLQAFSGESRPYFPTRESLLQAFSAGIRPNFPAIASRFRAFSAENRPNFPARDSRLQAFSAESRLNFPASASGLQPFSAENMPNFPARGRSSIPKKTVPGNPPKF